MASITVVSGPNEGDYYPVKLRPMVIGRDEGVPIQLRDELVSRKHVQIRMDDEQRSHVAVDMSSANGTMVNGRKIDNDTPLEDGDLIELGNSKLMFSTREFDDRESALTHWKQRGERGKSTLIR